jgi:hypothetical protein
MPTAAARLGCAPRSIGVTSSVASATDVHFAHKSAIYVGEMSGMWHMEVCKVELMWLVRYMEKRNHVPMAADDGLMAL